MSISQYANVLIIKSVRHFNEVPEKELVADTGFYGAATLLGANVRNKTRSAKRKAKKVSDR